MASQRQSMNVWEAVQVPARRWGGLGATTVHESRLESTNNKPMIYYTFDIIDILFVCDEVI